MALSKIQTGLVDTNAVEKPVDSILQVIMLLVEVLLKPIQNTISLCFLPLNNSKQDYYNL